MRERENMISTTRDTGNILCPYFIAHGKRDILCEGIIDGSRICLRFSKGEAKSWHQHTYCEGRFQMCEIYRCIMHWRWPEDAED